MKKFFLGMTLGLTIASAACAVVVNAAEIKQYILTLAGYPIMVNGQQYNDAELPILNYEGNTYVPLAKLGDLTGVDYTWNASAKRVEINTNGSVGNQVSGLPQGATIKPGDKTEVIKPRGLVTENGETVLYAYDRDNNFLGVAKDSDDTPLSFAKMEHRSKLPPSLADGFIGIEGLAKVFDCHAKYTGNSLVFYREEMEEGEFVEKNLFSFDFPAGWKDTDSGLTADGEYRYRTYNGKPYICLEDMFVSGLLRD